MCLVIKECVFPAMILAQECALNTTLVLKDTQDGFAGQTGTIWTIGPDCSFTIARQVGPKIAGEHKKGRLTPEQQAQLKDFLSQMAIAELPEQFGNGPPVNARRITFSYGNKVSVLTLAPVIGDQDVISDSRRNDFARQLLELSSTLKEMTGE